MYASKNMIRLRVECTSSLAETRLGEAMHKSAVLRARDIDVYSEKYS